MGFAPAMTEVFHELSRALPQPFEDDGSLALRACIAAAWEESARRAGCAVDDQMLALRNLRARLPDPPRRLCPMNRGDNIGIMEQRVGALFP